jgi:hypothetical protein
LTTSNSTHRDQGAIGEFAIGEFVQGPGFVTEDWAAFSIPVWPKAGLPAHQQQFFTTSFPFLGNWGENIPVSKWIYPLNLPVRIKPGLHPALLQFFNIDAKWIKPTTAYGPWYQWLREPVRLKPGLHASLQQFLAYHPRLLPKPTVTITMAVTEINADVAEMSISIYNAAASAKVSIVEIPQIRGGAASIEG